MCLIFKRTEGRVHDIVEIENEEDDVGRRVQKSGFDEDTIETSAGADVIPQK